VIAVAAAVFAPNPKATLVGLMIAILVGEIVSAATVLNRLRHHISPGRLVEPRYAVPALLTTVAMLPAIAAGDWLLRDVTDRLLTFVVLAGTGIVALALFAAAAVVLNRTPLRRWSQRSAEG
jgi:hypothetical protein